jgi:Tol biopolymer transport system component
MRATVVTVRQTAEPVSTVETPQLARPESPSPSPTPTQGRLIAVIAADPTPTATALPTDTPSPITQSISQPTTVADAMSQSSLPARSILFNCTIDDNVEICVIKSDGSGFTNLTNNPAEDRDTTWSPDGARIAFTSSREDGGIYAMDADGRNVARLNDVPDAYLARWSPDGLHIAFRSGHDGNEDLFVMDADGSNLIRLTNDVHVETDLAWSPDGRRIAFGSGDSNREIYVVNVDGSDLLNITNNPEHDEEPAWSPDGSRIAFMSWRNEPSLLDCFPAGNCNTEIYVMNADGSNPINLTNSPGEDAYPTWSPDGNRIAFASIRDGDQEIYVMNVDGSSQIRLTTRRGPDYEPAWSPDGIRIAFEHSASTFAHDYEISLINPDGSYFVSLAQGWDPVWQP